MYLLVGEIIFPDSEIGLKFKNLLDKAGFVKIDNFDKLDNLNLQNIKYLISRGAHFKYTRDVLEKFPNLKKIFLFQIGNDNVDLEYCKQKGIEVVNFISEKSIYSVAELTIASLIMGIRQAFNLGCKLKKRVYTRNPLGFDLSGKTIGVMGIGRIGSKVIELLKVFPVKIAVYDVVFSFKDEKFQKLKENLISQNIDVFSEIDDFFGNVDYVCVHIPGFKENLGLLDYEKLSKIKGVVNMSRAGIVVEKDILRLLDEGKLDFYISDVVNQEPDISKINSNLLNHEKVFILPHIGANTIQVQEDIIRQFLGYNGI